MQSIFSKCVLAVLVTAGLAACGGGSDGTPVTPTSTAPTSTAWTTPTFAFKDPQSSFDLANYVQTGRYSLPVGTGLNLLAEEASAVTYNKDTDTLFVLGDGGTSIVQVSKKGVLIDSMVLAQDAAKPQGTYFYDPEGLAYLGNGKFALVEERYRQVNEFTYVANTTLPANTLTAAGVRTVKLGTTIGNIGIEGVSYDPMTGGFIAVKESGPSGVFQTSLDFALGSASNGSATTVDSVNLFDPTKTGLSAHNDVFALSNILPNTAPDYSHIMILSAPDGKIVKMDRTGKLLGTLVVGAAAQNEGMTMDAAGNIYVVSEVGGGAGRPELLVFSPSLSKTAVAAGSNLYLTFNQPIVVGTGSVVLSNGVGDTRTIAITDTTQIKINSNTMVIDPATNLVPGTTYSVSYPAGLLKDASGNNAPALPTSALVSFATAGALDTVAPTLVSTTPLNNASDVTSSRILLNFNEPVVAGIGSITISNGTDTRTISVTDTTQVSFSGNTANINPSADFLKGSTYNVQLASGVIKDASGNSFAGIVNATTLSFNTAAPVVVVVGAPKLLITEVNSNAAGGDFFELLNYGTTTIDLAGWKWDDDSASFTDVTNATFGNVSIAPGQRLVVSNATTTSAFITAWNIPNTVTVVATGGPGLGGGDAVVIFDAAGKVVTSFNFKGGTVTMTATDGSVIVPATPSTGVTAVFPNHAGLAFGGTAITSAVWDGVSTSAPTYKAAAVGVLNGYAQPAVPTAIGSPGQ
jgi:uncharacterized protein YjiK/methionine-rich copper-binding protein CopC